MIVWPAKLYISHKPDTFCSVALIASDLCLAASTRRARLMLLNGMSLDCGTNMTILPVRFTLEKANSS